MHSGKRSYDGVPLLSDQSRVCVGRWQRAAVRRIPLEIFHLKVITVVRCGAVAVSGISINETMTGEISF